MLQQCPEIEELNRLYKAIDDSYHGVARKMGLSDSAFLIFYALVELGDGCSQREIAQHYYASKQTINSSIKGLERAGYLKLQPGPGRDRQILLTPAGRQVLEEKLAPVIQRENQAVEALSPQEWQTLLTLARKYTQSHLAALSTL